MLVIPTFYYEQGDEFTLSAELKEVITDEVYINNMYMYCIVGSTMKICMDKTFSRSGINCQTM